MSCWIDLSKVNSMRGGEMSPHLICLSWYLRSLLWPASGSGLDMIWKLESHLRHMKWGLILKLSWRPFFSRPWNPLRGFFAFRVPLPDCVLNQPSGRQLIFSPQYYHSPTQYLDIKRLWSSIFTCLFPNGGGTKIATILSEFVRQEWKNECPLSG